MALDDPPAGDDEPGRVEPEPAQRTAGLADQQPLVAARCAGHVPEPLDRIAATVLPGARLRQARRAGDGTSRSGAARVVQRLVG